MKSPATWTHDTAVYLVIIVIGASLALIFGGCAWSKNMAQGWLDVEKCYYETQGNRTMRYCDEKITEAALWE